MTNNGGEWQPPPMEIYAQKFNGSPTKAAYLRQTAAAAQQAQVNSAHAKTIGGGR